MAAKVRLVSVPGEENSGRLLLRVQVGANPDILLMAVDYLSERLLKLQGSLPANQKQEFQERFSVAIEPA